mgnify:CR=1 FL=1
MLRKFVFWTGASDFLVGGLTIYGAISILINENENPEQFIPLMVLGMFLAMAAACLMWASRDLVRRYPIIFWQGLVRLTAAGSILLALVSGIAEQSLYFLVGFDGIIGATYVVGSMKATKLSFLACVLCKDSY